MSNQHDESSGHPQRRLVMALVGVSTFMTTLDVSIVNVALPTLQRELNTQVGTSQWFALAYTFAVTVLLMLAGKVGDNLGRRRVYVAGILVFVLGSIACGCSVSAMMLIVSRVLQGIGAAVMMSAGPAMVTEAFPPSNRGKALGVMGTTVALGLCAGPMIGGLILQYATWHWMFFINVPIGLVLSWQLARKVSDFNTRHDGRLDVIGAIFLALAIASVSLALTHGSLMKHEYLAALVAFGVGCGVAFFQAEKFAPNPILNFALFKNRIFSFGVVTGWANYAAMMPVSMFLPFYLTGIMKFEPKTVGLIMASGPLSLAIIAPLAGSLSDRIGPRFLTTSGLIVLTVGLITMHGLTPDSTWLDIVLRLVLASVGSAFFVSPNSSSIMGSVRREDLGIASGTVALIRNFGMISGIAIAGAIITHISSSFTLAGFKVVIMVSAAISALGAGLSAMRVGKG